MGPSSGVAVSVAAQGQSSSLRVLIGHRSGPSIIRIYEIDRDDSVVLLDAGGRFASYSLRCHDGEDRLEPNVEEEAAEEDPKV